MKKLVSKFKSYNLYIHMIMFNFFLWLTLPTSAHELLLESTTSFGVFTNSENFKFSAKSKLTHDAILNKTQYQPIFIQSDGSSFRVFFYSNYSSCGVSVDEMLISFNGLNYIKIGLDGMIVPTDTDGFFVGISTSVSPCKTKDYQLSLTIRHEHI